jgi:formylglycine-generating enzyme
MENIGTLVLETGFCLFTSERRKQMFHKQVLRKVFAVGCIFAACHGDPDAPGADFVWIPPGKFLMGSPAAEPNRWDDETQHSVTLTKGLYMGKYQVTQELYQAVMGSNPSYFTPEYGHNPAEGEAQAKRPVEYVQWYATLVFCNRLSIQDGLTPVYRIGNGVGNTETATWGEVPTSSDAIWDAVAMSSTANGYRLPTEAEWEYACRAGTGSAYSLGDTWSDDWGWYGDGTGSAAGGNSGGMTHAVGRKTPNAWGLYDMHGNVWEWCWDWYGEDYYTDADAGTDPQGPASGSRRVLRGGCWINGTEILRSADRSSNLPEAGNIGVGFRVVRTAP